MSHWEWQWKVQNEFWSFWVQNVLFTILLRNSKYVIVWRRKMINCEKFLIWKIEKIFTESRSLKISYLTGSELGPPEVNNVLLLAQVRRCYKTLLELEQHHEYLCIFRPYNRWRQRVSFYRTPTERLVHFLRFLLGPRDRTISNIQDTVSHQMIFVSLFEASYYKWSELWRHILIT